MAKKEYGTRKKYHFIYKTTNLVSGKYYIGMHSTDDLNDGYLGSGTYIKRSINKHGKDNHSIEILEFLNSREELAAREKEIVSLQEIAKKECMNLKVGGSGGNVGKGGEHLGGDCFTAANIFWKTEEGLQKKSEISKRVYKKLLEEGTWKSFEKGHQIWKGRTHTQETRKKMSESKKVSSKGADNSQYGTCWITNEIESKKVKRGDQIPEGWRLGRKIVT